MSVTTLKATFGFADFTTRDIKISPYRPNSPAVSNFKNNIIDFNTTGINNIKAIFLSDTGAECTGITAAEMITEERTVIYALNQSALLNALKGDDN